MVSMYKYINQNISKVVQHFLGFHLNTYYSFNTGLQLGLNNLYESTLFFLKCFLSIRRFVAPFDIFRFVEGHKHDAVYCSTPTLNIFYCHTCIQYIFMYYIFSCHTYIVIHCMFIYAIKICYKMVWSQVLTTLVTVIHA